MKRIACAIATSLAICLSQLSCAQRFQPGTAEAITKYGRAMMTANGAVYDALLEAKFGINAPAVLSMLPAAGFENGVAGFFKRYGLYVVLASAEAYCQNVKRDKLAPGCYLSGMVQLSGSKPLTSDGFFCGSPVGWYKAPGSTTYVPHHGLAWRIAQGDSVFVIAFIKDDNRRLCD